MSETLTIPDWFKDARCYALKKGVVEGEPVPLLRVRDSEVAYRFGNNGWLYRFDCYPLTVYRKMLCEMRDRMGGDNDHIFKVDLPDGLYVAVERDEWCPKCNNDNTLIVANIDCELCDNTGKIKRLDLERAIELPYTRVLNHAKEWRTAHPDIPLSPIQPENYIKCVLKYCDYAALFFTDSTHEAVIKREDL